MNYVINILQRMHQKYQSSLRGFVVLAIPVLYYTSRPPALVVSLRCSSFVLLFATLLRLRENKYVAPWWPSLNANCNIGAKCFICHPNETVAPATRRLTAVPLAAETTASKSRRGEIKRTNRNRNAASATINAQKNGDNNATRHNSNHNSF